MSKKEKKTGQPVENSANLPDIEVRSGKSLELNQKVIGIFQTTNAGEGLDMFFKVEKARAAAWVQFRDIATQNPDESFAGVFDYILGNSRDGDGQWQDRTYVRDIEEFCKVRKLPFIETLAMVNRQRILNEKASRGAPVDSKIAAETEAYFRKSGLGMDKIGIFDDYGLMGFGYGLTDEQQLEMIGVMEHRDIKKAMNLAEKMRLKREMFLVTARFYYRTYAKLVKFGENWEEVIFLTPEILQYTDDFDRYRSGSLQEIFELYNKGMQEVNAKLIDLRGRGLDWEGIDFFAGDKRSAISAVGKMTEVVFCSTWLDLGKEILPELGEKEVVETLRKYFAERWAQKSDLVKIGTEEKLVREDLERFAQKS